MNQSIGVPPRRVIMSFRAPLLWNITCHMRTMEATGTIIGDRKNVLNLLFIGICSSSAIARRSESTTARGTAIAEKVRVFFAACLNAKLFQMFLKFSNPTKFRVIGLSRKA